MICPVCNKGIDTVVASYYSPDKYEKYMRISKVKREWLRCDCGLYVSRRNYSLEQLQKIYFNGYRARDFRGETIQESFLKVINTRPKERREIEQRYDWLGIRGLPTTVLDIGSGIGVWPWLLAENGHDVWCTEINKYSKRFIRGTLRLNCTEVPPEDRQFDLVSVVHVLEHMEDPVGFLRGLKAKQLFIEVPDAEEFEYLSLDNNEFSSDHVLFFDKKSLADTISRAGYEIRGIDQLYYKDRDLKRLVAVCS